MATFKYINVYLNSMYLFKYIKKQKLFFKDNMSNVLLTIQE